MLTKYVDTVCNGREVQAFPVELVESTTIWKSMFVNVGLTGDMIPEWGQDDVADEDLINC